jgi:hypothetical protein
VKKAPFSHPELHGVPQYWEQSNFSQTTQNLSPKVLFNLALPGFKVNPWGKVEDRCIPSMLAIDAK